MSNIAIRVENLSKLYHIGQLHQRPHTLRDVLADFLTRILRLRSAQVTRISRKRKGQYSVNSPNSLNSWQKEKEETM